MTKFDSGQTSEDSANELPLVPESKREVPQQSPWRKWLPLALTLLFGGLVLGWEYRETLYPLLGSPLLFLLICVGVHFLMHRGHGRH